MLFNSIPYLLFFPLVFLLYWWAPLRARRLILLVSSYVFYMSWIPTYGLLIAAMTVVNYVLGLAVSTPRLRKPVFFAGIAANLLTLCFFKYTNFLLQSVAAAAGMLKFSAVTLPTSASIDIILPLGISFFAFEFIHYLTDVYRGGQPIKSPIDFALFAAFFPSQIAGPIKRYQDFVHQLGSLGRFNGEQFNQGVSLFLQGLFKKVALSDNLAPFVNSGFAAVGKLGAGDAWIASLAFALQIYFDFSGYTDMGRGSAMMLGFALPDNFNFPYLARSLQDFWRRWHISLSSWLRDYLYIPLGGGRHGSIKKYANLFTTMLLGGLWHGAAWHFVVWGGLHGLGLIINHAYDSVVQKSRPLTEFHKSWTGTAFSGIVTFLFVLLGWIFFRADNVHQAFAILSAMFTPAPVMVLGPMVEKSPIITGLLLYSLYAVTCHLLSSKVSTQWSWIFARYRPSIASRIIAYCGVALLVIGFAPARPSAFIYFQF